ncbi:hypothetical protein H1R20_g116, partial [Candolleomyces eurysporus]
MRCFHADLTKNKGEKAFKRKKELNADIDEKPSVLELERWTLFVRDIPAFLEYESNGATAAFEDDLELPASYRMVDSYMNPRMRAFIQDFESRGFAAGEKLVQGNFDFGDRDVCVLASLVKDPDVEEGVEKYYLKQCVTKIRVRLIL